MNYQYHYDRLIETRRNRVREDGVYYENHHILPKSMGGSNDPENLVLLTPREHFLSHWLLWRIHRSRKMALAFNAMRTVNGHCSVTSSRGYSEARIAFIEVMRETMRNKVFTDEHRRNIGKSSFGRKSVHRRKISVNEVVYDALSIASQTLHIPIMTIRNRLINDNFPSYFYLS